MIQHSITGLDINTLASHMTAAGISTVEIGTEYHSTNIASLPVTGGKTGSLELLESDQVTDVTGELARSAASTASTPTAIVVPDGSQHLVIQNPPYLRPRGNRKMFDVTGISENERMRSVRRLTGIRRRLRRKGGLSVDGQAGLGGDFTALADLKLMPGGVLASVLPLTAAHAETWTGLRERLERDYRSVTVIAFASHASSMMSADTGMNEMLVVAAKREEDAPRDGTDESALSEREPMLFVNLNAAPVSVTEASWLARLIQGIGKSGGGGRRRRRVARRREASRHLDKGCDAGRGFSVVPSGDAKPSRS